MAAWTISLNFLGFGVTLAQQPETPQQWTSQPPNDRQGGPAKARRKYGRSRARKSWKKWLNKKPK